MSDSRELASNLASARKSLACVLRNTHVSVKGANCAACGSEIKCASKIASTRKTVSASTSKIASSVASASRIVGASKS